MMNNAIKNFLMTDTGFALLIIASVGDLIIPFLLAPFCDKYNHLTMVMSLLGNRNCPLHFVYNIWLVLAGIMFMFGSTKLYAAYSHISNVLSIWLLLAILIYAIGACILSGIFSVGETKELITISEKIHGYASVLGFFLLAFVPLIIAVLSFQSKDRLIGVISFLFFILTVSFFTLFIMADKEKFANTIISYEGFWQRLSLLCMYAPIVVISCKNLFEN